MQRLCALIFWSVEDLDEIRPCVPGGRFADMIEQKTVGS